MPFVLIGSATIPMRQPRAQRHLLFAQSVTITFENGWLHDERIVFEWRKLAAAPTRQSGAQQGQAGAYRKRNLPQEKKNLGLLCRYPAACSVGYPGKRKGHGRNRGRVDNGAGDGTRTRECELGKLVPYHLATPAYRGIIAHLSISSLRNG